jgi:hypothetical protein
LKSLWHLKKLNTLITSLLSKPLKISYFAASQQNKLLKIMEYNKLPGTDIEVSKICLGTMTWGRQNSEVEAFEQMDYSVDQRLN